MKYFCYQTSSSGRAVPVLFDERPNKEWDMCADVIMETVKEISDEIALYSLSELSRHFPVPPM